MKEIVVAGGCFWGVEAYYSRLKGVEYTLCGYANGDIENPTYEQVCEGDTNFVEAVHIKYDDSVISLEKILEHLFRFIDPTSLNKQGGDVGTQYRTGVYYIEEADKVVIENYIKSRQPEYDKPIVVEVLPLKNFFDAEEYHQQYLVKNPTGYCHVNLGLIRPEESK